MPAVIVPDLTEIARQWPAGWFVHGQCRLVYEDPFTVRLVPHQGNFLWVDGHPRLIPDDGVTLAVTGLTIDTTYLVFAAMAEDDTIILRARPQSVGHRPSPGLGIEVGGETPRESLVGLTYVGLGGRFAASTTLSWHHRRARAFSALFTVDRTTTSLVLTEIDPEIRVAFCTWADEELRQYIQAITHNPSGGDGVVTAGALDGVTAMPTVTINSPAAGDSVFSTHLSVIHATPGEGYHVCSLFGNAHLGGMAYWGGLYTTNVVQCYG